MKSIIPFFLLFLMVFTSCKKDAVDATNLKTFQESINDMASSLNTLQQVKFNEALYILKTFGVEADGETFELNALAKLISGKKVPEILAMADQVAQKNGISWSSTGPPSLGEMNIFGNDAAKESDPNDITATSIGITTVPIAVDSILGPKGIQVVPRLLDAQGKAIVFEGAALETTMEVSSSGTKLITSKNLMQDSNFKGFTIRYQNLPAEKITDHKIDVLISVKTTKRTLRVSKIGIEVNPKVLRQPSISPSETIPTTGVSPDGLSNNDETNSNSPNNTSTIGDPKNTVQRFLNNLSSQNLKGAFEVSDNPNWGTYDNFANPTSGFGSVKNLNVKSISTANNTASAASVNAAYDVTDKNGNTSTLKVTFGLKNVNGEWKISSYRIN